MLVKSLENAYKRGLRREEALETKADFPNQISEMQLYFFFLFFYFWRQALLNCVVQLLTAFCQKGSQENMAKKCFSPLGNIDFSLSCDCVCMCFFFFNPSLETVIVVVIITN